MQLTTYNGQYLKTGGGFMGYPEAAEQPHYPSSPTFLLTVGTGGDYVNFDEALLAINEGNLNGVIVFKIISDIVLYVPAVLYQTGYNGTANYSQVYIYPTLPGLTISGEVDGDLIAFNNTQNVILDGRVNTIGSSNLSIVNTFGGSSNTIHHIGTIDTSVAHCNITGNVVYDPPTGDFIMNVGPGLDYDNLEQAFQDINGGGITGNIVLKINTNIVETGSAILYQSGYLGNSYYFSIKIFPTTSNKSISGNIAGDLIKFQGAQYTIINGKLNWYGVSSLTLENTHVGGTPYTVHWVSSDASVLNTTIIGNTLRE